MTIERLSSGSYRVRQMKNRKRYEVVHKDKQKAIDLLNKKIANAENVKYSLTNECLKNRLKYSEALIDSVISLENNLKQIRKILGYEIINEALTEEGFEGNDTEWREFNKEPCDLYYILNEEKNLVKIGISKNAHSRIREMQTATGYYLELFHVVHFQTRAEASEAEAWLHREFSQYQRKPPIKVKKTSEWFDICVLDDLMANYSSVSGIQKAINEESQQMREKWKIFEQGVRP